MKYSFSTAKKHSHCNDKEDGQKVSRGAMLPRAIPYL